MKRSLAQRLRPEVFRIARADGGVDLVDLVLDRITALDADELRALDTVGADDLAERLAQAELFEGAAAEDARRSAWAGRVVRRPRPLEGLTGPATGPDTGPAGPVPGDWSRAAALPELFAAAWREPERWRRLAEDHAGGQRYLMMPGLLAHDAATRIRDEVLALPWARLQTDLVSADRHLLRAGDVPTWLDLLQGDALRGLISAVLGRPMPPGLVVNAWRLGRGDFMGVHPDGRLYFGTISLGLCESWTAADAGAIAFGVPRPGDAAEPAEPGATVATATFEVRQRWFPHLGDACLFAPDADTWHAVEPVRGERVRHSLTGWWVDPANGLTRGRA